MIEESSKPPQMSPASLDTAAELNLKNKKTKAHSKMDTTPNTGHPELVFAHMCLTVNALDSSISGTKKNSALSSFWSDATRPQKHPSNFFQLLTWVS